MKKPVKNNARLNELQWINKSGCKKGKGLIKGIDKITLTERSVNFPGKQVGEKNGFERSNFPGKQLKLIRKQETAQRLREQAKNQDGKESNQEGQRIGNEGQIERNEGKGSNRRTVDGAKEAGRTVNGSKEGRQRLGAMQRENGRRMDGKRREWFLEGGKLGGLGGCC